MAHLEFRDVFRGQWRLGARGRGQADSLYLSSAAAEELGPPETPPKGWLRRLGWHCRMLGRRAWANTKAEWPLAKPRLWVIIPCLIFQYIHAIFTGMAYYMHEPLPVDDTTLHDLGFEVFPYLSNDAVSEALVYTGFGMFIAWLLSPFFTRRKSFHFFVVAKRVLVIIVSCQVLRILTFLSTQLPAPAPHCRAPEPTSNVGWPVWWKVIIVDVSRQASKGCGDLIFSSHLTFIINFCWMYAVMGQYYLLKIFWFLYTLATAFCIIASRKHYTVDITVALYVVPLVFFHYCRRWTTTRDDVCSHDNRRVVALGGPALPTTAFNPHAGTDGGLSKAGSGLASRQASGAAHGGSSRSLGALPPAASAAAAGEPLGDGSGADEHVQLDLEMAQRASSAPLVMEDERPPSPIKAAARSAWSALADLPASAARAAGVAPAHRRTESQEPVLLREDASASSVGH